MKRTVFVFILTLVMAGCASMQATRKAQYLSDDYSNQVKKSVAVISLIDARTDKVKDTQELLSNKNVRSYFISNPLARKGYALQLIDTDTSKCGSLTGINNINEMSCLDNKVFQNGDLFMLVSIDQYTAPQGMHVAGHTKVTGVLYSKSLGVFIWKDSVEGNYGGTGIYSGLGGYVGMLTLKAMSSDLIFRNNAFNAINELLNSVPPFPNKH